MHVPFQEGASLYMRTHARVAILVHVQHAHTRA